MDKIILVTTVIDEWNDKLNAIASKYMDNAAFGGIIVLVLFIFGCWAISYFTKK